MPRHDRDSRVVVFVDADNTLWDTDAVFANAQLDLLANVEKATEILGPKNNRLKFLREFDQEIATNHHKGLRYPPALLAHCIALGLRGASPHTAANIVLRGSTELYLLASDDAGRIELAFLELLRNTPKLRTGVQDGLRQLSEQGFTIIIITEGSKAKCDELLKVYELDFLIERVIESPKHPDLYRRVCRLGGGANLAVMIGDQLDRDILPAKEAGLQTIYFPGGFRPKWLPSEADAQPDYSVSSFNEAVIIIQKWRRELHSR